MIDRDWPHQVALPNRVTVARHHEITAATDPGIDAGAIPHWFYRGGESWVVYCFAEPADAARIAELFGGELMSPDTRPRWPAKPSPKEARERRKR